MNGITYNTFCQIRGEKSDEVDRLFSIISILFKFTFFGLLDNGWTHVEFLFILEDDLLKHRVILVGIQDDSII